MSKTIKKRVAILRRYEAEIDRIDRLIIRAKAINARVEAEGGWRKKAREWKARQLAESQAKV